MEGNLNVVVQQIANAISLGAVYAMLALGLALVYSVLGLINFAHGELMTVGAYTLAFSLAAGVPLPLAVFLSVAGSALAAVALERGVFRPLRGAGSMTLLLASVAVSIALQTLFQIMISPVPVGMNLPDALYAAPTVGGIQVSVLPLVSASVAMAGTVTLVAILQTTTIGMSIRAVAEDPVVAGLLGVRTGRVFAATFALSGALAGIAGFVWAARRGSVDPLMGGAPLLKAFVASVFGGLGSLPGAVVGGMLLGAFEVLLQAFLPEQLLPLRDAFVFAIIVVILSFRPRGLFPARLGERPA